LNLHGRLIAVVDARKLLDLPVKEMEHTDHLIVLAVGEHTIALRADHATRVMTVESEQAEQPGTSEQPALIESIAETDTGLVHVLDPRQILSDTSLASLAAMLAMRTARESSH
jgi:purine-binding chemotaxis protein CheW